MRPSFVIVIACSVARIGGAQNLPPQSRYVIVEDARRSLAAFADALSTFNTDSYVYNRWFPRDDWSRLIEVNYDSDVLVELLGDTRPRTRTLAMALLFNKEDPKLLMPVARLFSDTATTFPVLLPTDNADPRATAPQTVSDIAKQFLGTYMLAAGMQQWRDPQYLELNTYDASQRNRPYSLSWLIVRLGRITLMQSPFPERQRSRLLTFRKDVDSLPPEDRDIYLLWLCHGNPHFDGGEVLATEMELVDAAKRLGRQKLLQIVDGRPPGTDPDVAATQEWQCQGRYRAVISFLLAHADQLFTRGDEPFLAAIEQGQRDKIARGARADLEVIPVEALARARAMLLRKAP